MDKNVFEQQNVYLVFDDDKLLDNMDYAIFALEGEGNMPPDVEYVYDGFKELGSTNDEVFFEMYDTSDELENEVEFKQDGFDSVYTAEIEEHEFFAAFYFNHKPIIDLTNNPESPNLLIESLLNSEFSKHK